MIEGTSDGPAEVRHRPALLVDLLLVVAALAVGFGLVRYWLLLRNAAEPIRHTPYPLYPVTVRDWFQAARLILLPTTLVVMPMMLVFGRSGTVRPGAWLCPGAIVPVAVLTAVFLGVLNENCFHDLVFVRPAEPAPVASRLLRLLRASTDELGIPSAVVVAWVTMAVGGRWTPEVSWAGRLGRMLGLAWILGLVGFRLLELGVWLISGREV